MITGMFLTALCFKPIFGQLQEAGNPALSAAVRNTPVTVHASTEAALCDLSLMATMLSSHADNSKPCVKAKKFLVSKGIDFQYAAPAPGQAIAMTVGGETVNGFDAKEYGIALTKAGYPAKADSAQIDTKKIILLLFILSLISAMIYGPVAAYLVELFPPNIRVLHRFHCDCSFTPAESRFSN